MLHKPAQKRIYFEGATYFTTFNTKHWIKYFEEPIFCEIFIAILRLSKKFHKYNLFAFVVLINHAHLLFFPHEAKDLSKIMQFIKRHVTRDINCILGYEGLPANKTNNEPNEEAISESLLRSVRSQPMIKKLNEKYQTHQELINTHCELVRKLRQQFVDKYGNNQSIFPKFKWHKSFRDHYIRNHDDFEAHMRYITNNPFKHQIPDAANYKYIYTNYPDIADET